MKHTLPVELHAVTVFSDRAELSYEGKISLSAGTHTLTVQGERGWEQLDASTVQVNVEDAEKLPITLRNVGFVRHVVTEDIRDEVRQLTLKLKEVINQIHEVDDGIAIQEQSNKMILDLQELLTQSHMNNMNLNSDKETNAMQEYLLDVARWEDMANFIAASTRDHKTKVNELNHNKEKLIRERRRLEEALNIGYDMPLSHISTQRVRTEHVIEIALQVDDEDNNNNDNSSNSNDNSSTTNMNKNVNTKQELEVKFYISFVVYGARWEPLYDLRVNTSEMNMEVNYYANVFQSTRLDWHKVRLRLSTATPHFNTIPPEFDGRWEITLRPPPKPIQPIHPLLGFCPKALGLRSCKMKAQSARNLRAGPMATANALMMDGSNSNNNTDAAHMNFAAAMAPTMEMATLDEGAQADSTDFNSDNYQSQLSSSSSSSMTSVFTIAGLQSVKSDNKAVKVTVMRKVFPVKLRYLTAPKLDPLVYVMASAVNNTSFDLLPGTTSVFYDNTFVNSSRISLVPPSAPIDVSLGADDGIHITRKLIRRVESTARVFFTVKRYVEYTYTFDVESKLNHHVAELVLRDHYPHSVDSDLYIELLEPNPMQLQTSLTHSLLEEERENQGNKEEDRGKEKEKDAAANRYKNTSYDDSNAQYTRAQSAREAVRVTADDVGRVEWKMQLEPLSKRTVRLSFRATYPNDKEVYGLNNHTH